MRRASRPPRSAGGSAPLRPQPPAAGSAPRPARICGSLVRTISPADGTLVSPLPSLRLVSRSPQGGRPLKSGKQRRKELEKRRTHRAERLASERLDTERIKQERTRAAARLSTAMVNPKALAPYDGWSAPEFLARGLYVDQPFTCPGCGSKQVWTATQQKWWYEVAKGDIRTIAVYCRTCRRKRKAGQWTPEDQKRSAIARHEAWLIEVGRRQKKAKS